MPYNSMYMYVLPITALKKTAQEAPDDYDRAVRELVFERRGQPTDRLLTEKEAI